MKEICFYESRLVLVKFIYSEKNKQFDKITPFFLTLLTKVKKRGWFHQIFVAFSKNLNFNKVVYFQPAQVSSSLNLAPLLLLQVKMYSMPCRCWNDRADFWITFKRYLIDLSMTKFADFLYFFRWSKNQYSHKYFLPSKILEKTPILCSTWVETRYWKKHHLKVS